VKKLIASLFCCLSTYAMAPTARENPALFVKTSGDDFSYIAILSSGWWISDTWAEKRGTTDNKELRAVHLKEIATDFNRSVKLLYFTQGGPEDLAYDNGMETFKLFDAAGIKYKNSESPGGYAWKVWRKNLWELTPLLFN
jgi:enterochelin esterase-like enzyme